MRKSWVQIVDGLGTNCADFWDFSIARLAAGLAHVHNITVSHSTYPKLSHSQITLFRSVRLFVLPSFHTTYNYNYLYKYSYYYR